MTMNERIAEVFLADKNVQILYWEIGNEWQLVGGASCFVDTDTIVEKGIAGLADFVKAEDLPLCQGFISRIEEGLAGEEYKSQKEETYAEVPLRLNTVDFGECYSKVMCHFLRNDKGCIERIVMEICRLAPEDIYRIELAQHITNDKNPVYFAKGARELVANHPERKYAIIQFDVVKFKLINEQYGEEMGDSILHFFVNTLKMMCNEYQLYTRLSADVFMILTPYETMEDIQQFIKKLDEKLLGYQSIQYTLVYGVCMVTDIKKGLRKFGDGAALARQSVKGNALEHIGYYEEKMTEGARVSKFVEDNMEKALENHEFIMYLQPKYSISEEQMVGAEALVRWMHPEKGMISPMDFVPLFEQNGFVIKMDKYIWEEACKTIRHWMDTGIEPLPISVNVSRRHLKDFEFIDTLNQLIQKYDIPKHYLEIEITETVEEAGVAEGITRLKESGYTLLMDDFGSGYSSLNMLKDTQFDVIKIDRGFLQNFIGSDRGQKIVEHTIRMTQEIGLDTVAEGVETEEQANFLSGCGCDTAQGFYYAKPMPLAEFEKKRLADIDKLR